MDILKSFEVFLSEPLSVLKDRFVQIVGINTLDGMEPEITVDMLKNKAQITVMNNDRIFNILKRVNSKSKNQDLKLPNFLPKKTPSKAVFGQLTLRA
jgi:hypothetical protein